MTNLYSFQILAFNNFLISNTIIIDSSYYYSINDSTFFFWSTSCRNIINWRNQLAISPYNIFSNPHRFSTLYVYSINQHFNAFIVLHHIQGKKNTKTNCFLSKPTYIHFQTHQRIFENFLLETKSVHFLFTYLYI